MTTTPSVRPGTAGAPPDTDVPPDGGLPPGLRLSYERTVPRDTAHRRQVGEVFVTDSAQTGPDDFHMAFEVLRAHSLWSDRAGSAYHDPMASAEAARQSIFVLLHRHVGIPVTLPFSLQRITLRVLDPEAYRSDRRTALRGTVHYRVAERAGRGADVTSMTLRGTVRIGGRPAMALNARLAFMSQEDYDVFRAFQRGRKPVADAVRTAARPLPPAAVGRALAANVVLGAPAEPAPATPDAAPDAGPRLLLAADTTHPAFFDHDYDHVPGPLMVEGMRQAALVAWAAAQGAHPAPPGAEPYGAGPYTTGEGGARAPLVAGCEAAFLDFVEFEADVDYRAVAGPADADGRIPVDVAVRQFGRDVLTGRIDLLPEPAFGPGPAAARADRAAAPGAAPAPPSPRIPPAPSADAHGG